GPIDHLDWRTYGSGKSYQRNSFISQTESENNKHKNLSRKDGPYVHDSSGRFVFLASHRAGNCGNSSRYSDLVAQEVRSTRFWSCCSSRKARRGIGNTVMRVPRDSIVPVRNC